LIIYHKNYTHSRVPAATVAMATSALSVLILSNSALIQRTSPSCTCHRRVFANASGHTWFDFSRPLAT